MFFIEVTRFKPIWFLLLLDCILNLINDRTNSPRCVILFLPKHCLRVRTLHFWDLRLHSCEWILSKASLHICAWDTRLADAAVRRIIGCGIIHCCLRHGRMSWSDATRWCILCQKLTCAVKWCSWVASDGLCGWRRKQSPYLLLVQLILLSSNLLLNTCC